VFVLLSAIYLVSPVAGYSDGRNAGPTAASIVIDGDLDITEFSDVSWYGQYQTNFVNGRAYDYFPWTRSVWAVPVAALVRGGEIVGVGDGPAAVVRSDTWEPLLLLLPGALATAGAAALTAAVAWRFSSAASQRKRCLVALASGLTVGLTTGYWSIASRGMWQHGPACFWLAAALLCAWHTEHGSRRSLAAVGVGAAAMAAAWTRPTFIVIAIAIGIWMAVKVRERLIPAAAGAFSVSIAIIAINLATFGEWLMPYYDISRRELEGQDSVWFGVFATIASPSRGVLVFMPFVIALAALGLVRPTRDSSHRFLRWPVGIGAAAMMGISVTSPEGWWAGHSFGPRFAVDVLPVLMFLAIPALDRFFGGGLGLRTPLALGLVALALWSGFVNAQGALIRQTACWNTRPTDIDDDRARVWRWSDTQALTGVRWILGGHSPLATDCNDEVTPAAGESDS